MSYLIVSSSFTQKDMEEIEDWKDHKDDLIDFCEDDHANFSSEQRDKCESYIDSISSIILSNGRDINEKLAKVSSKTEYLFYMVHTRHINVDFNNLLKKMVVYMHPINITRSKSRIEDLGKIVQEITKKIIQSSFDGTQESNIKFAQLIANEKYSEKRPEVLIEGSISDKVSFLTISHMRVVYYHEFKCENLYISSGVIVSMTNSPARVNNFIIDTHTFSYYSILPYLETDQFSLVDFNNDNNSIPEYQIAYYDLFWGIQCVYDGNFVHGRYHWKVPYFVTKKLAIICYSYHVIIEAVNQTLIDYPDVNITVTDGGLIESEPTLSSKNEISIESKGFDTINKDIWPSVVVTYDKDKFSLDKSKSDLDVDGEQIYTYKPKSHKDEHHGLIIGVVVTLVVVLIVAAVVVVVLVIKKKKDNGNSYEIYEKNLLNDQTQPNNYHDPVPN